MKSATSIIGMIPPYNNRIFGTLILSFMLRVTFIFLRNIFPFKKTKKWRNCWCLSICVAMPLAIFRVARTNEQHRYKVFDHYGKSVSQSFAGDAGGSQIARSDVNADGIGSQRFRNVSVSH